MIREAVVAGQFYPGTAQGLSEQIESMVDKKARQEKAIGVVAPHAGYVYSGFVAGCVYSSINITDTVVILGPNHTGVGAGFSLFKKGKWRTPLGEVEIDTALAEEILESSKLVREDEAAHSDEHSLEVQLPFMQYFRKDFKIVPMVLSPAEVDQYEELAQAIVSAIKKSNRDVLIIASSDMTHYESHQSAKDKDSLAIDAILSLDEKELLKRVKEHNISMCGYVPVTVMLIAAKALGAKSARLLKYQTSGEASGDYNAVVGYAGVIVK